MLGRPKADLVSPIGSRVPRHPTLITARGRVRGIVTLATWLALGVAPPALAVPSLPTNFVVEDAVPGTSFTLPTSIAFLPDGRMLVGEKQGLVWMVQNGTKLSTPFLDIRDKVLSESDRGLIDVAVDPNFATN